MVDLEKKCNFSFLKKSHVLESCTTFDVSIVWQRGLDGDVSGRMKYSNDMEFGLFGEIMEFLIFDFSSFLG